MAEHTLDGVGTVVKKNGYTAEVKLIDEGWESRVTFVSLDNPYIENRLQLRKYAAFALAVADEMDALSGAVYCKTHNNPERLCRRFGLPQNPTNGKCVSKEYTEGYEAGIEAALGEVAALKERR